MQATANRATDSPGDAYTGLLMGLLTEVRELRAEVLELRDQLNDGGNERPLHLEQVAEWIGVQPATVASQYLRKGRIKGHKSGQSWLVYPSDLHAAIRRNFEQEL